MKYIAMISLMLGLSNGVSATTLSIGDVSIIDFTTLTFIETPQISEVNHAKVEFFFSGIDLLNLGDSFTAEYFQGSLSQGLFSSVTYSGTEVSQSSITEFLAPAIFTGQQPLWIDLQGTLRLTVLSGSIDFNPLKISVWDNSVLHSSEFDVQVSTVPLPASLWLFLSGLVVLFQIRAKSRNL